MCSSVSSGLHRLASVCDTLGIGTLRALRAGVFVVELPLFREESVGEHGFLLVLSMFLSPVVATFFVGKSP